MYYANRGGYCRNQPMGGVARAGDNRTAHRPAPGSVHPEHCLLVSGPAAASRPCGVCVCCLALGGCCECVGVYVSRRGGRSGGLHAGSCVQGCIPSCAVESTAMQARSNTIFSLEHTTTFCCASRGRIAQPLPPVYAALTRLAGRLCVQACGVLRHGSLPQRQASIPLHWAQLGHGKVRSWQAAGPGEHHGAPAWEGKGVRGCIFGWALCV